MSKESPEPHQDDVIEASAEPVKGNLSKLGDQEAIQNILALISSYTDRPDLLIAELEKHDPGFVKRMNAAAEKDSAQEREERFYFGKRQAYSGLFISIAAALSVLGAMFFAIHKGASASVLVALAVIYAVTQGGSRGFMKVVEALVRIVRRD